MRIRNFIRMEAKIGFQLAVSEMQMKERGEAGRNKGDTEGKDVVATSPMSKLSLYAYTGLIFVQFLITSTALLDAPSFINSFREQRSLALLAGFCRTCT